MSPSASAAGAPPHGDRRRRALGWGLVLAQFALLGALVWPLTARWRPAAALGYGGTALRAVGLAAAALAAIGLGGSLTPSPVPRRAARLVTRGAYRWVRHPIYAGLLLFALGSVLATPHPVRIVAAVALAGLLDGKSRWEERLLARRLAGYRAYAASVGRFFPRLR